MNKALWKDLEKKKISKQELVNTRFSRLFAHFGFEKDGTLLAQRYQFYLAQQGKRFRVLMNFWTASSSVIMSYMLRQMALLPFRQGAWLNLVWHLISIKSLSLNSYKHKSRMLFL